MDDFISRRPVSLELLIEVPHGVEKLNQVETDLQRVLRMANMCANVRNIFSFSNFSKEYWIVKSKITT